MQVVNSNNTTMITLTRQELVNIVNIMLNETDALSVVHDVDKFINRIVALNRNVHHCLYSLYCTKGADYFKNATFISLAIDITSNNPEWANEPTLFINMAVKQWMADNIFSK